jgi:hypothetical protein
MLGAVSLPAEVLLVLPRVLLTVISLPMNLGSRRISSLILSCFPRSSDGSIWPVSAMLLLVVGVCCCGGVCTTKPSGATSRCSYR